MTARAIFSLALHALIRNRSRSLLTMLGVIIGVAAVIVTVAIGVGARVISLSSNPVASPRAAHVAASAEHRR